MELTIMYFWVVKLTLYLASLYSSYKAFYKNKFKSKFWNITTIIILLFLFYTPIKMDVDTKEMTDMQNYSIKQTKVLPERVTDNSFEEKTKKDHTIQQFKEGSK